MSVVAPAVYVGTWHKYNCGSIAGRWFDLTTFDDERDFFAACRALHQDEADPELMFQDYEGFPGNMASECHINWAWVEGFRQARDEGCEEAYRLWVRIPLYSITDWHRSPISDSHPFDQPGT